MGVIVEILTEEDLHRYVDGQLDRDRADAVGRWLDDNPEARARVDAYHRQIRNLIYAFRDSDAASDGPVRGFDHLRPRPDWGGDRQKTKPRATAPRL